MTYSFGLCALKTCIYSFKKKKRKSFRMGRTRPKIPKRLAEQILLSTGKRCYHCGCRLNEHKRSSYHIDHHPVAYRDVEDQCCFGVTDPLEAANLVPSCVKCNVSHRNEIERWYYCGKTQFPCKRRAWRRAGVFLLFLASTSLSGLISYHARSC